MRTDVYQKKHWKQTVENLSNSQKETLEDLNSKKRNFFAPTWKQSFFSTKNWISDLFVQLVEIKPLF